PDPAKLGLRITRDFVHGSILLEWRKPHARAPLAQGKIRCTGSNELTWELEANGPRETTQSTHERGAIHAKLSGWLARFPARRDTIATFSVTPQPDSAKPLYSEELPFDSDDSPWDWLENSICTMAEELGADFSLSGQPFEEAGLLGLTE